MKTQDIKNIGSAWMQVQENQKAALAKKLAKSAASSEKGKAAVTLPKAPFEIPKKNEMSSKEKMKKGLYNGYVIPEDVPVDERDMFMAKAAAAHKAGKSHFSMNGKKHPVTMKKDTANAVNSSTNEGIDAMKKAGNAKADAEADERKKMKMKSEEMDETKPCPKCDGSMENHEPDCPMSKESKGNDKEVAVANPKQEKAKAAMEGTVYSRILEKKSHTAGATKPEDMHDKSKSSKGAMDMLNTPKEVKDNPEASGDDVKKAGASGPKAKARPNDNMKGDKQVINPITQKESLGDVIRKTMESNKT